MLTRRRALTAAALALALAGCQSTAGSSSSSGGSVGGSSSSGGTSGGDANAPNPFATADVHSVTDPADKGNGPHTNTSDDFDGCKIWFGFSQASSATYLVAASKEGIGGHAQWKCARLGVGVDRLRIAAHLEYAYTLDGPYTSEPASLTSGGGTNASGNLFPLTDHCTTDWWRVRVTIGWDETGGGPRARPDLVSEARRVTSEDCNRN